MVIEIKEKGSFVNMHDNICSYKIDLEKIEERKKTWAQVLF
jgi:hypothetical protein